MRWLIFSIGGQETTIVYMAVAPARHLPLASVFCTDANFVSALRKADSVFVQIDIFATANQRESQGISRFSIREVKMLKWIILFIM